MQDFNQARIRMVDCQIRPNDVTNPDVLAAMAEIPRERFIPENMAELAYIDEDIAVARGRYLMEPAPFAKLVQAANIGEQDVVLDIGCATGYSTAVLSRLASLVIAIEEDEVLAGRASAILDELECNNTAVIAGAPNQGYASEAPYDVIFIGGAVDVVPQVLFDQLKDGGRLVCVEGQGNAAVAKRYMRVDDDISGRRLFNCAVKPLPGFEKPAEFVF